MADLGDGPGLRRVYACANLPGLRVGRWHDVPDDDRLVDLLAAGLLADTDPAGRGPPSTLARLGCCGDRR